MSNLLPKGYRIRPASIDDLEQTTDLFNDYTRSLLGVDKFNVQEIEQEWQSPGFNLATDTRLVQSPEGCIAGYSEVWDRAPHVALWCWFCEHPNFTGKGIAGALLEWAEERARQSIPQAPEGARVVIVFSILNYDQASAHMLRGAGFGLARSGLRMEIEMNGSPPLPKWPAGIHLRAFRVGQDERSTLKAMREAFSDHWGYIERPFEEELATWTHHETSHEGYDPSLWFLAMDGDQIAGVSLCRSRSDHDPEMGWVGTLCVHPAWRRRGLALALLNHSFAEFYQRGKRKVELGVDSQNLTGAVRLYHKAGMHSNPLWQRDQYEKELRSGVELRKQ